MPTITTKIVDSAAAGGGTGSEANPLTFDEMRTTINGGSAGASANTEYVLNPGTYTRSTTGTMSNGGSSSGQCIIRARYPGQTILLGAVGAATTRFQFFQLTTGSNASYITWDGLVMDGNFAAGGTANTGIQTTPGANLHHHVVKDCVFTGMQGTPCGFVSCDYTTILRNQIYAIGKRQTGSDVPNSASSGVSLNAGSLPFAFDAGTGYHNIIAYNVIAGCLGPPSDGNGIILDNGGTGTVFAIQNTLIIRNIVYGNGARGYHGFRTSAPQGHWFVNNISFKNGIDQSLSVNTTGGGSEFDAASGGPYYFVSNVAVPWSSGSVGTTGFRDVNPTSNYIVDHNKRVTGGRSSNPMTATAGQIDDIANPGFVLAPTYNPATLGDAYLAPDPRAIGSAFDILSSSVLKDAGTDPRTNPAMTAQMQIDITPYLTIGFAGRQAPY